MAFKGKKQLTAELPMLTAPKEKKELIMYLAAVKEAISVVLMTERDGKQVPIYFVSRAMREGTFLGYKVDADELRVCPDKVEVVLNLPSPKCLNDVQKLNEKLASLNRFMSKSAEKFLPFFKTLKKCTKKSDFQWIAKSEMAFKGMKQLIAELPMLTAPKKEELIMYLAATKEAISTVLMTERDGKQVPIYFVSRALQGPEINYTPMEKLILALVSANKWLKRYFQEHTIVVITDQPIKQLLSNPEVTGRLLKWRFKLGEHDIQYRPRTLVKGQILADFIVKHLEDDTPDTSMEDREELLDPWILFTDRSSCIVDSGANLIIINPKGMEFTYALGFRFNAINNEVEYEAMIAGLRIVGDNPFKDWCENLSIHQCFASVKHPQPNGMVGRENRSLGEGIKARLRDKNKNQVEKISHVLWAHRTMIKSSNKETPFSLTYGAEAVIPAKIGMPTLRTTKVDMVKNNKALELAWISWRKRGSKLQYKKQEAKPKWKDITMSGSEARASIHETLSTETTKQAIQKMRASSDLSGNFLKGAYRLRNHNGHTLPRTWNICNLKKCYMHEM
uniref:Reverse transcriptase domain-containing protein n=1 Tax=Tanacetum cinerariifolium TaxID=118510 RepID=A0A6L2MIP6_TANCI|nr:reverse transcriptase domain-containing protein [Tanacetum cinerariifolium]